MDARWERTVLHADMDAFFAAVEQLDHPELKGKPLLIGHPGPRGVVATASYEARPFGVGSAMPMAIARRKCPEAIIVPPRHDRYAEVSREVMAVFLDFSPIVEPLSLDEAFLDMTGTERLFGPPDEVGRRLKAAVRERTGLTVSVGLAGTKFVAKIASDLDKPDGLTVIAPEATLRFLAPLPIHKLWGVGEKTRPRLEALGLSAIGDVARADPSHLAARLGSLGTHLSRLARGEDPRPVVSDQRAVSIGAEETLAEDILGAAAIEPHLRRMVDRVAERLRRAGRRARGVRVKLKTHQHVLQTRQTTLAEATHTTRTLWDAARPLVDAFDLSVPMRLVGMAAFDLDGEDAPQQQGLFDEAPRKNAALDAALDQVRARFGSDALKRGDDVDDPKHA